MYVCVGVGVCEGHLCVCIHLSVSVSFPMYVCSTVCMFAMYVSVYRFLGIYLCKEIFQQRKKGNNQEEELHANTHAIIIILFPNETFQR